METQPSAGEFRAFLHRYVAVWREEFGIIRAKTKSEIRNSKSERRETKLDADPEIGAPRLSCHYGRGVSGEKRYRLLKIDEFEKTKIGSGKTGGAGVN
jgi:hypothetical protein